MFMLGFEEISESDKCMFLLDFESHVEMMRLFKDIAEKSLATGVSGQTRILDAYSSLMSDDPYVVVIHLGYFYFLRFVLLTLHTDHRVLKDLGIGEQIKVAADAIEVAAKKLDVLQLKGMACRSWIECKQQVLAYVDSVGTMGGDDDVVAVQKMSFSQRFTQTANLIANELRSNTSEEFVDVFLFMHLTRVVLSQTNVGQLLVDNDLCDYVRVSCSLRSEYFTEDMTKSVETIRCRFTEALDHPLDAETIQSLHHLVGWQVHGFLQCLKPPRHFKHKFQTTTLHSNGSLSRSSQVQRVNLQIPTVSHAESFHSEMLGEGAVVAGSTGLLDTVSFDNAVDKEVGTNDEKRDEDNAEKEDFEDMYDDEDEVCAEGFSTVNEAMPNSSSKGFSAEFNETRSKVSSTICHQSNDDKICEFCELVFVCLIDRFVIVGYDVEELVQCLDSTTTFRERCLLLSSAVNALRQKSAEKEKLSRDVCDLQESFNLYREFNVVVDVLKPVWEEKKKQLAVAKVEIETLKTLKDRLCKRKKFGDTEHGLVAKFVWKILRSANGDYYKLSCLDSAVVRSDRNSRMLSEEAMESAT